MTAVDSSSAAPPGWGVLLRILLKALLLFALCNGVYALTLPLESLGRVSLYNVILPGRERLPYGENPAQSYNLSLNNLPAMLASHTVSRPPAADEYRVLLIGDSNTWGWLLEPDETLAAALTAQNVLIDGRRVVAYNLGYPIMALSKDLLLLDVALPTEPDLVIWLVTLASFPPEQQLFPPLVQANPDRMRRLIAAYALALDPADSRFIEPDFFGRTLIGQRRDLANWLRLQTYGFAWAATGIDQFIPATYTPRQSDLAADDSWSSFDAPTDLSASDLALEVLAAGVDLAAAQGVPVVIVNEPMFISSGANSDRRYNSFYPRWAYDQYRELLAATAQVHNWHYRDWWDSIAPNEFTDSPVHLSAAATREIARRLAVELTGIDSPG